MKSLDGIVRETKKFLVKQTKEYDGKKEDAKSNLAKAAIAGIAAYFIDSDLAQVICGAYAVIKIIHAAKDLYSPYKNRIQNFIHENYRTNQRN